MLQSGFLRPITDRWSQKAVSADKITDTNLFKAFCLSRRIIYSDDPIKIFRHLLIFRQIISFLKMNSPLRWLLWEGIFLIWGVEGGIFYTFFKNIYLSHLHVWSCIAFLFWHSCNCGTIAYTQHKPDFMRCEVAYTRFTHTPFVCSPCAVRKRAEAALTVLSHGSLQLIRGCLLQTQHLSIILISNPNNVT